MARRLLLRPGVGERLLTNKLQILTGAGSRRPGLALSILTGRNADHLMLTDDDATFEQPLGLPIAPAPRRYAARTVYLSERHLRDIDFIIQAWQQVEPRHLTRSAVLRRAVEHLRAAVEAGPAQKSTLENN